jgi:ABC-type glutathione transport system ATPase component
MIDFAPPPDTPTAVPVVSLIDASRTWRAGILGATERINALQLCSLAVHPGEIAVISGAAGSGKSTLLLLAAAKASATSGTILWNGHAEASTARPQLIGPRPWEYGFLTVRQALAFHADVLALAEADLPVPTRFVPLMLRVGLRGMSRMRLGSLRPLDQFRVVLAQALMARPRLLCCDEPFAFCGPSQRAEGAALLRGLARSGLAIIVATREPAALAAIGERVRLHSLDRGRLRAAPAPHHHFLELAVPSPEDAMTRLLPRLPSLGRRGRRLRVPLGGISPEAVLAVCRDAGVSVHASRVAEEPLTPPLPLPVPEPLP